MNRTLNTTWIYPALTALLSLALAPNLLFSQACQGLGSITLNVLPTPQPTIPQPPQLCAGAVTTLTVTQTFPSYSWSTGDGTQSIQVSAPTTYTVTVSNAGGCTGTASVTVSTAPAPTPSITQLPYACNGQATLNAGATGTSYAWSNGGGSGPTATYTSSGTYTVTVTNAAGCTGTDNFTVTIPTPPQVTISGVLNFCTGLNTTLNATPGFTQYAWSGGGGNSASITVSTPNTYTVTVTDNFGCTDTETATVTSLPSPTPLASSGSACPGNTITLNVTNGPFQSYAWSNSGSGSSTTAGVGNYTVTVTAANGCTGTTTAAVNPLPVPNPVITALPYACNGQLTLNAGAGFSSYAWSTSQGTSSITVSNSSTYTVTVTNPQGCSATDTFTADIPSPPAVSISGDISFCSGQSANLNASPGLVNYAWNSGQNGPNISVSTAGTFTVTATDNFGCTATDNISVAQFPSPAPVITGAASICAGNTATLSTTLPFPSYSWSTNQSDPSITVSTANTYTVTVTAANGCTGTDTQVLAVLPAPNPVISEGTYLCDEQITLSVPGGFSTYAWSISGSGPSITVATGGAYTVTVSNAQGCTGTDTYVASIPATPFVNITGANTICPGSSTTLNASAGFNMYQWSTASGNPSISVSAAGNFTVTVTDDFGCTATDVFSVSLLAAPNPNISGPAQICATSNATFSVPGSFTAFSWSTGVSTPTITVNTANTYTVTVTAANGCTGTDTQTLVVANNLQPQITELPYACNGQISLDAGNGFSSYAWSVGQNTQSITVTADDTYTVTVSDASGCTGTAIAATSIPTPPAVSISGANSICAGAATLLSASAGLNAYVWSTGQVGSSISVGTANTFTVTATDAYGCTVTDDFQLGINPAPVPAISGPSVICTNNSGTLALNGSFSAYAWNTGANTASIVVDSTDTYAVTVTDANGCTGTASQLVTEVTGLSPSISQLPYACTGTQTLDAGAGFNTYLWSGGQTGATISVNTAETFTVTVTDASGCTGTGSFAVSIPPAPQVSISGNTSFCQNLSTTLLASAGFASYLWSSGANTDSLTTNVGNTFTVTVTDAFGCTDTESIVVVANALPQPQISGPTAICAGNNATLTPGPAFVNYAWSTGSAGASITADTTGAYSVTVTDVNGCTGTDDALLTVNSNPVPSAAEAPYACDAQITLNASAGFNAYQWAGPNGFSAATSQAVVSSTGTYALTVTDANGCTGTTALSTTVPALTQVTLSGPTQFCPGGSADLTASAGFAGYAWSNGQTLPGITADTAGTYTVKATDALGCTSVATAVLSLFPQPVPAIAGPQTVCPGNTATLSVTGNFTAYAWSDGSGASSLTSQPPFSATVTVTDANGCTGTASASVVVSTQLTPSIAQQPYACDGQITLDAGPGFNYSWAGPNGFSTTGQLAAAPASGTYTVTVSDGGGCSGTATVQITLPTPPQVFLSGDTQLCPAENSTLSAGPGFDAYAWSTGSTLPSTDINGAGTFTVTVTDALGCTATATLTAQALAAPTPAIDGPITICGSNPVDLSVTGGVFASFVWSTTATSAGITVGTADTYTVTVTDADGCTGTAQLAVQAGGSLTASIVQLPYVCDSKISLDAGAGFAGYAWSNGSMLPTANVTQSGTYTVTVTDANGCSGTATLSVTVPQNPVTAITGVLSFCAGGNTLLSAGNGFSSYAWSSGSNLPTATVTQSGTYTVTVTDAIGCSGTATASVVAQPNPVASIAGALAFCKGNTTTLTANSGFTTYAWSSGSNLPTATLGAAGSYTVTVTDGNGCTATASATLQENSLNPALQSSEVFCQGSSLTIIVVGNYPTYQWSDGSSQSTLTVSLVGTYTVTVTDANGCTGTASSQVLAVPPASISIGSANTLCGNNSATLSTTGSTGDFAWSNGGSGSPLVVTQAGVYTVTVTDANGCTATATQTVQAGTPVAITIQQSTCRPQEAGTETLILTAANGCDSVVTLVTTYQPTLPGLALDLAPVVEAALGQEITLNITGNFTIDSVEFESPFTLSCSNCLSPSWTAQDAGFIQVTAFDAGGCQASAAVQVIVRKKVNIYVPNAFLPGSGQNGTFTVYSGPEISVVRNFNVYDRWGNALFSRSDMPTNDPSVGWDGSFRNQPMQPGVYVYYFEVTLADGTVEVFSGDVTIMQ
ncbi:MAG: gliding motility-associated C-terminal domain-containing protein [Saprospiraceae bacterium]|nr:gliding motility-associated C-terminal domain-containing protein [Saprospiraceae bacterium]